MIEAEIHRNDQLIMARLYKESDDLSLEQIMRYLEMYVINEQLNTAGECLIRVRYSDLRKINQEA